MNIKNVKQAGGGYFMADDGGREVGRIVYDYSGNDKFIITHTEVSPEWEGRGIGKQLVMACVNFARENNLKIIPMCSFAREIFIRTPDIRDVLYS